MPSTSTRHSLSQRPRVSFSGRRSLRTRRGLRKRTRGLCDVRSLIRMSHFPAARRVIVSGLDGHAYPAAVIEVGRLSGPLWCESFGRLTYAPDAPACGPGTIFDLASLTKVIATTSIAMRLRSEERRVGKE